MNFVSICIIYFDQFTTNSYKHTSVLQRLFWFLAVASICVENWGDGRERAEGPKPEARRAEAGVGFLNNIVQLIFFVRVQALYSEEHVWQ